MCHVRAWLIATTLTLLPLAGARATVDSDLPPNLSQEERDSARKLSQVSGMMKTVAGMLAGGETGTAVQQRQQDVLKALDGLLDSMGNGKSGQQQPQPSANQQQQKEQQQDQQSDQDQQQPAERQQRSQADANRAQPQGGDGDGAAGSSGSGSHQPGRWGELPPHAEQALKSALKQEFLERYRHLLHLYFTRLAEEE